MNNRFHGYYYKHQKGPQLLSVIAGNAADHAFVQLVTQDAAYRFRYPKADKPKDRHNLCIGNCVFSGEGIALGLRKDGVTIEGKLRYTGLTPLRYSIMGPFQALPLPCKHEVVSMAHHVEGRVTIGGQRMDFSGGTGYVEGDAGRSFPDRYLWVHCGAFERPCSIMASVADIPFLGGSFQGCVCAVLLEGREYRMATYLGVRVVACEKDRLVLRQGRHRLEIQFQFQGAQALFAPVSGKMTRIIHEQVACPARFRFLEKDKVLFDEFTDFASVEVVE